MLSNTCVTIFINALFSNNNMTNISFAEDCIITVAILT